MFLTNCIEFVQDTQTTSRKRELILFLCIKGGKVEFLGVLWDF